MKLAAFSIEGDKLTARILRRNFPGGAATLEGTAETFTLPQDPADQTAVLQSAVEAYRNSYGIKGAVIGLEISSFTHNFVDLPVQSESDIGPALGFELEKYLPLPPEEYAYDFVKIRNLESGSRSLVLSIRRDRIDWILRAFRDVRVPLVSIRCSTIEALNEFISTTPAREVAFAYCAQDSTTLIGLQDAMPESIKVYRAPASQPLDAKDFLSRYQRGLYVAGIADCHAFDNAKHVNLQYSIVDLVAGSYAKKRVLEMNFLPPELAPEKTDYFPYAAAALAGLCVALFFMTAVMAYFKDASALDNVRARLEEIKTTSSELVEMKKEMEAVDRRVRFLNGFQNGRNKHIRIVTELSRVLPMDSYLISLNSDEKGKVEIQGLARRSADIIRPLENSPLFKNVEFSSPVTVMPDAERFSIKMEVEK